ncbi:MAG: hypothetical protein Kow0099_03610 [Candidatus Abyssubacteria bacterium]
MTRSSQVEDIAVGVPLEDVLGPLGYGGRENVEPSILEKILSETERCRRRMRGRAIYSLIDIAREENGGLKAGSVAILDETLMHFLDGANALAVAVCTVGEEIDRLIEEYFAAGDYLGAMIADVFANRALEEVANKCSADICSEARKLGCSPLTSASPGYGAWDTSGQRVVFALLDPAPIGVSLNEHCMMQPKKSLSFVVPLVEGDHDFESEAPCKRCGFRNCAYRRS